MTYPFVSIVIPTFNEEPQHLRQAVESARAQTHPYVEVIVVDDGSTRDESREALSSLSDVTVIRQENQGPSAAMDTGIRAAHGAFVLALGGDDWIEPQVVELLLQPLITGDAIGAFPKVRRFGMAEGHQHAPPEVRFRDIVINNVVVATCLYRRSHWQEVGGYNSNAAILEEDWLMWLKLLHRTGGRFVQVPEAVLHYRLRPGSRSHSDQRALGVVQRQILSMMPEAADDLYVAAALEGQALKRELEELRAFHNAWAPRVRPFIRVRDRLLRRQEALPS